MRSSSVEALVPFESIPRPFDEIAWLCAQHAPLPYQRGSASSLSAIGAQRSLPVIGGNARPNGFVPKGHSVREGRAQVALMELIRVQKLVSYVQFSIAAAAYS
jgi:hypothetical protein